MMKFLKMLCLVGVASILFTTFGSKIGASSIKETEAKSIKILAIGNSFSTDAMAYIYQIAESFGYEEIILGNLGLAGASLEMHAANIDTGITYFYEKNTTGTWETQFKSIEYGIKDEDWDVITLQQNSGLSGMSDSYNTDIDKILIYINEYKTNPNARILWHMTWAYQHNCTHNDFSKYNKDQIVMYNSIIDATQSKILTNDEFDGVIPAGTAIQNVRTSHIGDTLTRDGYHLSMELGRFIAGVTWFITITGEPIDELTYVPNEDPYIAANLSLIKESVKNAIDDPFNITESTYKTFELDLSNYVKMDWKPVPCTYWNSRIYRFASYNSNVMNLKQFISSENMFTKEELPIGSIIAVESGYKYRRDAWKSLDVKSVRSDFISDKYTFVTDVWWGDYKYVAFNLTNTAVNIDVTKNTDEISQKFAIYVPKDKYEISSDNRIRAFLVDGTAGIISGDSIQISLPEGADIKSIVPDILFNIRASIEPEYGSTIDLSSPVELTVTAEDGSVRKYTVRAVSKNEEPPKETTPIPAEEPTEKTTEEPIENPTDEPADEPSTGVPVDEPSTGEPAPLKTPIETDGEVQPTDDHDTEGPTDESPSTGDKGLSVYLLIAAMMSVVAIVLLQKKEFLRS